MKYHMSLLAAAACLIPFAGCASIISGGSQKVSFTTHPTGAEVTLIDSNGDIRHKGETPFEVRLPRGDGFFKSRSLTMHVDADGYPRRTVNLKSEMNPWYLGNLAFGGVIGFVIVDPLTGAMWAYPRVMHVDLTDGEEVAIDADPPDGEAVIRVIPLDDVPPSLRPRLIRLN